VVEEQNNVKQITFILSVELIGETIEILKKKTKT
jgi:predicted nucleic acid-binding protein